MQPLDPAENDRDCIIDAAYSCLAEQHSGPVPVAAILARAGVSSRTFYRHFGSKDELFLAMLRRQTDSLARRLDRIADEAAGTPADQLAAWLTEMFALVHDPRLRSNMKVIESAEVIAARGYRQARAESDTARERSLVVILRRGRADGTFPLAEPESDAVAISAAINGQIATAAPDDGECAQALARALDFALRATGARR